MDRIRKSVQAISSFLFNANLRGFLTGRIYQGSLKTLCVPGLNCYSCPGALGACPLGSLQSQVGASQLIIPLYVLGFLTLFGAVLGRFICGWLCPFGLFQELLHLIPTPKATFRKTSLTKLKYIFLAVFVVIVPVYSSAALGYSVPAFCKYICPAGTIFAGVPILAANQGLQSAVGTLFLLKTIIAVVIVLFSIFLFRPFCKYICPLGAIYGFFNKVSLVRLEYEQAACGACGSCGNACKTGLCPTENPNDAECIRCGLCARNCPSKALRLTMGNNLPALLEPPLKTQITD